ncbi:MAG: cyclic nucleotide-binding domain-containing protein [Methylobacter sp.]
MSENRNINRVLVFLKGDIIFHEGQPSDHFYVLQKGEVEVFIRKNEKRFVIGTLGPGEFFGEMGLLSDEPRSASCRAITPVEVARIGNDDFKKLLKNSHPLVGKILSVLLKRLKKSNSLSAAKAVPANFFYAVANLLDLNFKAARSDAIATEVFVDQVSATLGVMPHQVKSMLQRFCEFGLIRQEQDAADSGCKEILRLQAYDLLTEVAIIQDQQPDKILPDSFASELELLELKQALALYGIEREKFSRAINSADFPEHLLLVNKSVLADLMKRSGKSLFEKAISE